MAVLLNVPNILVQYVPVVFKPQSDEIATQTEHKEENATTQTDRVINPLVLPHVLHGIVCFINTHYPELQCRSLRWGITNECHALETTRLRADIPPSKGGPFSAAKLVILNDGCTQFSVAGEILNKYQVLLKNTSEVNHETLRDALEHLKEEYVFCSGIEESEYDQVCTNIPYKPTSIIEKEYPFRRFISNKCKKWLKLRYNATQIEKKSVADGTFRCAGCNESYTELRKTNKRHSHAITSKARAQREATQSKYPIKFLTPESKDRRLMNQKLEKKKIQTQLQRATKKLEKYTIELCDEDSEQLSKYLKDEVQPQELQHAFDEVANETGCPDTTEAIKKAFYDDQAKCSKLIIPFLIIPLWPS